MFLLAVAQEGSLFQREGGTFFTLPVSSSELLGFNLKGSTPHALQESPFSGEMSAMRCKNEV